MTKDATKSAAKQPAATSDPKAIHWRDCPLTSLQSAAKITGCSPATLYAAEKRGGLTFKRLGGRTLIETASLIKYVESASDWAPRSGRVEAACDARRERARASWSA